MSCDVRAAESLSSSSSGSDSDSAKIGSGSSCKEPEAPQTAWQKFMQGASVTGTYIFTKMEAVGEGVADLLGLNDSKFQYVIDSMDDKDWDRARAVDAQRRKEDFDRGKFKSGVGGMPEKPPNHQDAYEEPEAMSSYNAGVINDSEKPEGHTTTLLTSSSSSKSNQNVSPDGVEVTFEDVMHEQMLLEVALRQGLSHPDRQRVPASDEDESNEDNAATKTDGISSSNSSDPVEIDLEGASGIPLGATKTFIRSKEDEEKEEAGTAIISSSTPMSGVTRCVGDSRSVVEIEVVNSVSSSQGKEVSSAGLSNV